MQSWPSSLQLQKYQAISGLVFGSYLSLHIPTILSAHFGPFAFDEALNLFRHYYQNPAVEAAILSSGIVHVVCGSILYARKSKIHGWFHFPKEDKLRKITGKILSILILFHFIGARFESLIGKGPKSEYSHIRASLMFSPLIFGSYYSVFGVCGFYHLATGTLHALEVLGVVSGTTVKKIETSYLWKAFMTVGCLSIVSSVISFFRVKGIEDREEFWTEHLRKMF